MGLLGLKLSESPSRVTNPTNSVPVELFTKVGRIVCVGTHVYTAKTVFSPTYIIVGNIRSLTAKAASRPWLVTSLYYTVIANAHQSKRCVCLCEICYNMLI